jgi:hypothetical protein
VATVVQTRWENVGEMTTESSADRLFGQSPKRYGITSLIAACLAFASWPLMSVFGFLIVYAAVLPAIVAVVSGLLGVASDIHYKAWPAVVTGGIGMALAGFGLWYVWVITHSFSV